ncbi:hypothetical protein GLAREA_10275 [Glarea lozoyensis ATCC 20868]|uniref:Uncharacterized protein n=1 Tax=Glarea lozoyensis (strain ATCC 20868 / MF5171) TaxID=1116229 RepID=S3DRE5_GLAL2|nr:uncharacterized protein GLAREA_10275 [Glarea lozoyensis ATCC 20868]EPE34581.1 hypothetical protein GLAREA_10275 [Glarea lozoyensis ATCC 20868]
MSRLVDVDVAQSNVPRPGLVLGLLRPVWRYCLAWAQDFVVWKYRVRVQIVSSQTQRKRRKVASQFQTLEFPMFAKLRSDGMTFDRICRR